jgi:hypothetical protein
MENMLFLFIGLICILLEIGQKLIKKKVFKEILSIFQVGFIFLSIGFVIAKMIVS